MLGMTDMINSMAEFRRLRPHPEERSDRQKKENEIRGSKHPRREIVKEESAKPMRDKAVWVRWCAATVPAKNVFPHR